MYSQLTSFQRAHDVDTDRLIPMKGISINIRIRISARASGVLLVAGVGSYCAYRICTKFLGQRFVWMLLDSARLDTLASADRRLLYASGISLSDDERNDGDQEQSDSSDTESRCEPSDHSRRRFTSSRTNSEVSLQRLSRYPRKSRGLFAIRHSKSGPEGVLRRQSASGRSVQSYSVACSSSSDKSASLRIVWEGQQNWDDEFATTEIRPRPSIISRTPLSQPKIAQSNSAGDLGSVFDDVLSLSSAVDQPDEELYDNAIESDDAVYIDTVRRKCMIDSKYMYQSVIVASSELGSQTSGSVMSSSSNLKQLSKRLTNVLDPKGLWELAQETSSTSRLKPERCEMTDSGLSRSTQSKHSQEHRSMFDSAIGGEVSSSEDEWNGKFDRHMLNPLRESDSASQVSLEWCDEGLRHRESVSEDGARFMVRNLDRDYESSRESAVRSSKSPPFTVSTIYRPKDSRDLMVFACEKFQPYSSQFKTIQHLYHRRRLRRIGPSPRTADETLKLFISSVLYHGYDILKKSSPLLEKSFESCVSECNFLHRWKGTSLERMREDLRTLMDTKVSCSSSPVNESLIRGLALLMVLSAREVYEGKLAGDSGCSWFTLDSPAEVMSHFERNLPLNETCWRLLGSTCDVSIEMLDFCSSAPNSVRFGNAQNSVHWLRVTTSMAPQPLFYVPDN